MKKLYLFLISILLIGGASFVAASQLEFGVRKIDPTSSGPGHGRGPIIAPYVCQNGYELEIEAPHAEYELSIVSGTTIVYSVVVPANVNVVYLPTTLVGTFELQLYGGGEYYFYSEIELE